MKKPKLLGIEFIRGVSTYAVVLVHSGDETWGLSIDNTAINFRLFFYFAVPFFLAAAFYFMTANPALSYSLKFWRSRVERILVPYIIWSIIFLISRVIIFTGTHKTDRLHQFLQDPLSIIFLGGASYHLYFLPLLLTGTLLVLLMPLLERLKINSLGLLAIAMFSVYFYNLLEISGNGFHLGEPSNAFEILTSNLNIKIEQYPLLRLLLVESAWTIRCLPYFAIALILNKLRLEQKLLNAKAPAILSLAILVILCNTTGKMLLPLGLSELLLAFTLLLFSMIISRYFSNNTVASFVTSIGKCSFGVYLIHPFVMYLVKPIVSKIVPSIATTISISSMLAISILCFLISWAIVAYLTKNKPISKYLFGV